MPDCRRGCRRTRSGWRRSPTCSPRACRWRTCNTSPGMRSREPRRFTTGGRRRSRGTSSRGFQYETGICLITKLFDLSNALPKRERRCQGLFRTGRSAALAFPYEIESQYLYLLTHVVIGVYYVIEHEHSPEQPFDKDLGELIASYRTLLAGQVNGPRGNVIAFTERARASSDDPEFIGLVLGKLARKSLKGEAP